MNSNQIVQRIIICIALIKLFIKRHCPLILYYLTNIYLSNTIGLMEATLAPNDKIELVDDKILSNEEFKKNVAIPYFRDIFKDLVAHSDNKQKGINKVTLLTYTNLPGIIGERFFAVMDLSKSEYVDIREFVHGFFKIYYSNLETKIKLSFDM